MITELSIDELTGEFNEESNEFLKLSLEYRKKDDKTGMILLHIYNVDDEDHSNSPYCFVLLNKREMIHVANFLNTCIKNG